MRILGLTVNIGKTKSRSQMFYMFTDDGKIKKPELDVMHGCAVDMEKERGILLSEANQYLGGDKQWYQIAGERCGKPISTISPPKEEEDDEDYYKLLLGEIYHEARQSEKHKQYEKARNNEAMDKFLWMIAITCTSFLLYGGLQLWKAR